MKRRTAVTGLAALVSWPVVARAQQPERVRRIGLLTTTPDTDPEWQRETMAFVDGSAPAAGTKA